MSVGRVISLALPTYPTIKYSTFSSSAYTTNPSSVTASLPDISSEVYTSFA